MTKDLDPGRVTLEGVSLSELTLSSFREGWIRVLVVVDGRIGFSDENDFGVGRFIRLLRETTLGCTRFSVDIAARDERSFLDRGTLAAGMLRYQGFRFDMEVAGEKVLHRYDEVFLFGFQPGGGPVSDTNIVRISASEHDILLSWMNSGHGVFATGDHHILGASLCSGVPRVRSMRRWTGADEVPYFDGTARIDTNQPRTPEQLMGTAMVPDSAQRDATPQPITWIPMSSSNLGSFGPRRPHEILCHPTHGPIDVMPDHAHEGMCFTTAEIKNSQVRRADFPGTELPRIIARGQVVPDPPFQHQKGEVKPRTIEMISAYDGWKSGVGRVVVDSTWHHWFNMNLAGLERAGGPNWDKISRYFINVAKWIAPKMAYRVPCWWEVMYAHFDYPGVEEFHPKADALDLGKALRQALEYVHGPCTIREVVLETIADIMPELAKGLRDGLELPRESPCLTCPPIDLIEAAVLGGFVLGTMPIAEKVRASLLTGKAIEVRAQEVKAAALAGAERSLRKFSADIVTSARGIESLFSALEREPVKYQ